jgi:hypothetical protein
MTLAATAAIKPGATAGRPSCVSAPGLLSRRRPYVHAPRHHHDQPDRAFLYYCMNAPPSSPVQSGSRRRLRHTMRSHSTRMVATENPSTVTPEPSTMLLLARGRGAFKGGRSVRYWDSTRTNRNALEESKAPSKVEHFSSRQQPRLLASGPARALPTCCHSVMGRSTGNWSGSRLQACNSPFSAPVPH